MHKIIRYINQNRRSILIIILFLGFIILIIQLLNNSAKRDIENGKKAINITNQVEAEYGTNKSVISNQKIEENTLKNQTNVIDEFINYCNNSDIQSAYNLISDECKEIFFPKIEIFKSNYIDEIFNTKKIYTIDNWNNTTYKVRILDNMLATGKANNGEAIEDYYTIVYSNDGYKLNINKYIGKTSINKEKQYKNINVKIISKDTHMNYEIYNIIVENKTENDILLDSKESTKSIYLKDSNEVKYPSYSHEIVDSSLIVKSGSSSNLSIKFTNSYISNRKMQSLCFSDIVANYREYKKNTNKEQYTNRIKVEVEI